MKSNTAERRKIVGKADKKLSIKRQCELLSVVRSVYYHWLKEKPADELNLELMRHIDEKYLQRPHMGVRSMTAWLRHDKGYTVNHKRISRLYRMMGLSAIAPGPHTSKGCKSHRKYPYLLRGRQITGSNQAWGIDITYIPIKKGYMYLVAIIDLYSRYVVGWSLSNTMDTEWVVGCVKETILRHGSPEIINSDQGSQFTCELYTDMLKENGIAISMDGKGRATDNIFIERFWRSLKYEDIYLRSYENGTDLYKGLCAYFKYYNQERRHSSLDNKIPCELYLAA